MQRIQTVCKKVVILDFYYVAMYKDTITDAFSHILNRIKAFVVGIMDVDCHTSFSGSRNYFSNVAEDGFNRHVRI